MTPREKILAATAGWMNAPMKTPGGLRHRIGKRDWYEEWSSGPLLKKQTVEKAENCPLPGIDQIRDPDDYAGQVARLKQEGKLVSAGVST